MENLSRWKFRLALALVLFVFFPPLTMASVQRSVSYQVRSVCGVPVHAVFADLSDRTLQVTPAIAYGRLGRRQGFAGFMARHHPIAQITGAYFGLRDALPIGDIVIDSRLRYDGAVGSALAVRDDNTLEIIDIASHRQYNWQGYCGVVQGGIRLVRNGKGHLSPRDQGFRDPGLFRQARRTAVGITARNKFVMVAVNRGISLSRLAAIMRALGCRDAMTLDGGTSTGLAYAGRIIVAPGRSLSNVLMVVRRTTAPQPIVAVSRVGKAKQTLQIANKRR